VTKIQVDMTKSQVDGLSDVQDDEVFSDSDLQVTCDVDGIIAGLDYDSFELLPGTVNARPGMRFADVYDTSESPDSFFPPSDESSNVAPFFSLPSPISYWVPAYSLTPQYDGKKRKKNKKRKNKNQRKQRQLQVERVQLSSPTPYISSPTPYISSPTPYISDTSSESPVHSPMKPRLVRYSHPLGDVAMAKKAKKKAKQTKTSSRSCKGSTSWSFL